MSFREWHVQRPGGRNILGYSKRPSWLERHSERDWLAARPKGQPGTVASHRASQVGEESGLSSVRWMETFR